MRKLLYSLLALFGAVSLNAQENPNWLRYSAISPDGNTIVFTYKGDIYKVAASGGDAIPLTFHEAHDYMPVWSRDGKHIAFASDRYGNFDVFVMSIDGGEAKRLTFHSSNEYPYSFSADNKSVIFGGLRQDLASHRQYPTGSQPELYSVSVTGGRVDMVWTIPAEDVQVSQNGNLWVYHDKKGGENEWRKHHTSAITRDIWVYNAAEGSHRMITKFEGEDRSPVLTDNDSNIFYLSEESGSFNVHKLSLENPSQKQQITRFSKHPVRFLSASQQGLLCFGFDGEIYTMAAGQEPKKVSVRIRVESKSNTEKVVAINGGVREMALSPNAKEIAVVSRGEIFVTSVEGGITKRLTNTHGQESSISFSPDGESIIYAGERNGKWAIYQTKKQRREEPFFYASTLLKEEPLVKNDNDNYLPKLSPDGKMLAYVENRTTLKVMDLATKQSKTLLTPNELYYMRDGDQYFEWSPDSKWLMAEYSPTMSNGEIVLLRVDGSREMINLTQSGYNDSRPKWVNEGKQILWFSNRDGLRSMATSGAKQTDAYTLFLNKDAWDKFNMNKDDYKLMKDMEELAKKDAKKEDDKTAKVQELQIDWDDLSERKARLTIHSSALGDAVLSKDGEKLYYLTRFERGMNLWSTNIRTRETKMEINLDAGSGRLEWDKEMKNLFLLADGRVTKLTPDSWKREAVTFNSEMKVDALEERKEMFDHVWHRNKAMFYISDFHGADWDDLKVEYSKYLPHIGNSYEFAEMLSEMLGELNVSHSGARYSASDPNGDATASLGIFMDYKHKTDGIKIEEIIKGGPLDKAGLNVKAGMIIEQIDGEVISASRDVAQYLNRKTNQFILLSIFDPTNNSRQQITIKPISLGEENRLLYRRWVLKNQEEVDRLSNGELGYVHIPGMGDGPYRTTYEEMMGKYHDRKGVVVDTRFNGGGDLVADLAMFFTGEKFIDYAIESRSVGYEPTFRWTKPTVAMFNESNYSDGHCFACGYTDLKIGKTIGMPVPGTCSFAGWESLADGTRWGSVSVSAKNKAGEWMENNETKPDVQVKNDPNVITKGRDQQLERAVEELLKLVNN